ncbi:MAG: hypothetical protein FWE91_06605 [Defluviitaleaceae bacterium]|nr:hypothetical protein [Defluviitaleaceae bacterium]
MSFRIPKGVNTITRSIRIPTVLLEEMDTLAQNNNISFNKLAVHCFEYAIKHLEKPEDEADEQN